MRGFPLMERKRKKALYLSTKVLVGGHYFYVSYWGRDSHFPWSPEPREGLAFCRIKAVPSCVAFKPLCKREHPRIVRFSSLYNAYFDKICHSHDCCVAVSSKCFVTLKSLGCFKTLPALLRPRKSNPRPPTNSRSAVKRSTDWASPSAGD